MRDYLKSSFWGNIYVVLTLRLLLVFGLYSLTRLMFYVFNQSLFADIDAKYMLELMWLGVKFDASAIAYTNVLVILMHILPFRYRYNNGYQKSTSIAFYVVNTLSITLNIADIAYYPFTLRRTTTALIQEFENENISNFLSFIWSYWYLGCIVVTFTLLLIWMNKRIKVQRPTVNMGVYLYSFLGLLMMAFIGYYTVGAMRGGYKSGVKPINLSSAVEYVRKPEHGSIVLNTPFSIIRTIGKNPLSRKDYFDKKELETIFNVEHQAKTNAASLFKKFVGQNVVIVIWESLHKEWVGIMNKNTVDYSGFTPFFDSLSTQGYLFARAYANGRKSVEAPPAIFAGIPSSETPFVLSHYSGNGVNSLASLLKPKGYSSAFFHGAVNGSMGFNTFINQAGFDRYYGMTEYNNNDHYDGHWGIWDELYLQYTAQELNKLSQPFLASVFTLSSHYPFKVPEAYEGQFPKGHVPLHECIGYSDHALRQFFNTASQQEWFNNTLFIITADHAVNGYLPEYKTAEGAFAIPILFYSPGSNLVGYNDSTVVQHTDIMPTLLSMLGVDDKYVAFGNNMFDKNSPHFAFNFFNGSYQLIEDEWMLQFTNEKTSGFYNVVEDRLMKNNLVDKHSAEQLLMERRIKSLIQQYNNRLIDNELTPIKNGDKKQVAFLNK